MRFFDPPETFLQLKKAAAPLGVLLLFLFGGCVSGPEPYTSDHASLIFESGGVYLSLSPERDIQLAAALTGNIGFAPEDLMGLLEQTERVDAIFFPRNDGSLDFHVLMRGSYPRLFAVLGLKKDPLWNKKSGQSYTWWEQEETGLQIFFAGRDLVGLSRGGIEDLLCRLTSPPRQDIPPTAKKRLEGRPLGLYASKPTAVEGASNLFRHIETFWMSFDNTAGEEEVYFINAEYLLTEPRIARSLYFMLRLELLTGLRQRDAGLDLRELMRDDPVEVSRKRVVLKDYPVSLDRLTWFFSTVFPLAAPVLD